MAKWTLTQGRRGAEVQRWQTFLAQQGLLQGRVDGAFGPMTDAATRAFQARHGLTVDGVVGENTLRSARQLGFIVLQRVRQQDVTHAMSLQAKRLLSAHHREPLGSEFPFESGGKLYYARLERHYHPPGGPMKPWGDHVGISLFEEAALETASLEGAPKARAT